MLDHQDEVVGLPESDRDAALEVLNTDFKCDEVAEFERELKRRIVGQEAALQALTELYQVYRAGMSTPGRPIGNLLFLGPTGSGKTRCVEAAAEALFGSADCVVKINCAELQHSHEISKLIGSPPGYLGHRETPPLLTQENLERHHNPKVQFTFVLFDEIEKASDALWQLLLGILDKAILTLGDNRRVDFSRTILLMTSNLGAREMSELMEGKLGFVGGTHEFNQEFITKLQRIGIEAARRKFAPEFINRIDKMVVFHPLNAEDLKMVLELELEAVHRRVLIAAKNRFMMRFTQRAKEFFLIEGYDRRYGARPLKRAIERHLIIPLANIIATKQVGEGDIVHVDVCRQSGRIIMLRERFGAVAGRKAEDNRGTKGFFGLRSRSAAA